ncbi:MAG: HAMP domain-containing histidine kinase, partial [Bdellovibrionales bacterium]|nr:HAMP domain-containing histidine kinase [Bdellovibrionales bacterium]
MKSTRWAFLALAILASIQVLWWAYLVIHQQVLIAELTGTVEALGKAKNYRTMIVFEGAFFVFVWSLGVWYAYRSIKSQLTLQEERRSFLSAITHELKTPLSTIQLSLETISRPNITEEQAKNFITRSLSACKKLFYEIETILTYNESEKVSAKEVFQLKDFLNDIKSELGPEVTIEEKNVDALIFASYLESKAILKNIVDNAVKYSSNAPQPKVSLRVN